MQDRFERDVARIEARRVELGRAYRAAGTREERQDIREEARRFVVKSIAHDIVPAWLGKPWTMAVIDDGLAPDAAHPFEKGKGVSCSWFVVSVLNNAGLRLSTNRLFAGTIAIHLQHSLSPGQGDIHRFWNITPAQLEKKMIGLGDGLYVVGLNCHIGFIHVDGQRVRFMHSSYVEPAEVVIEDITDSAAIDYSREAGYVVSPLFGDNRLIDHWLTGRKVPFQKFEKK